MGRPRSSKKPSQSRKPPLTHFLCLPLMTHASKTQFEQSLKVFREQVNNPNTDGEATSTRDEHHHHPADDVIVHPKAIRPSSALHLTLGVMSLNTGQVDDVVSFLQSLDVEALITSARKDTANNSPASISDSSPLQISLQGLESMHPPQETSILYAAPTDVTERLFPFCVAVQTLFRENGFLVEDSRKLKLHATIVNTIYAKGRKPAPKTKTRPRDSTSSPIISVDQQTETDHPKKAQNEPPEGHGPNANPYLKMDARGILQKFKNYVWAEHVNLDRLAICEMGAKKIFDNDGNLTDERYTEVATVALPK